MAILLSIIFIIAQIKAAFFLTDAQAWHMVYGTKWFAAIMWLFGINLIGTLIVYKTYKKLPVFILHLSIILILLGAAATRYFGYEGILHIREGQTASAMMIQDRANPLDAKLIPLGFKIRLDRFVMKRYPGSMQPLSYESYVEIIDNKKHFKYHIYMNHILKYKGYRFYQMSYDKDEKGSVLSVNHDPGMRITYFGYFLFALGFFASMFYKKSRFSITTAQLKKSALFIMPFVLFISLSSGALTFEQWSKNSKQTAEEWSHLIVESGGRIEPADTLDLDLIHKISKTTKINGMNYNQLVIGMLAYPEKFQKLPMIYIGHPKINKMLHIDGKYVSYDKLFGAEGLYKFADFTRKALSRSPASRSKLDREVLKLNERVFAAYTIYTASAFRIFPPLNSEGADSDIWYPVSDIDKLSRAASLIYYRTFEKLANAVKRLDAQEVNKEISLIYKMQKIYSPNIIPSAAKIKMEIIYNHLGIFSHLTPAYLLFGLMAIFIGFMEIFLNRKYHRVEIIVLFAGFSALFLHTANMGLRWYIASHAPWSNAYESIVFISWGSAFASLVFFRRSMLSLGAGLFTAGMFMFAAHLNNIDPQITNLVPVLNSYWLLIHVAVVTSSYGFLGVGSILGFLNLMLFTMRNKRSIDLQIQQISDIIYAALYIGLALLSIGTLLGGVWANESWGRYWSWDPKETWSLITIIVYAIVMHTKLVPSLKNCFTFSLLSFLSFYSILMTYFGVNFYIAQGLHSYGQAEGALGGTAGLFGILDAAVNLNLDKFIWYISIIPFWTWAVLVFLLIIIMLGYRNRDMPQQINS